MEYIQIYLLHQEQYLESICVKKGRRFEKIKITYSTSTERSHLKI